MASSPHGHVLSSQSPRLKYASTAIDIDADEHSSHGDGFESDETDSERVEILDDKDQPKCSSSRLQTPLRKKLKMGQDIKNGINDSLVTLDSPIELHNSRGRESSASSTGSFEQRRIVETNPTLPAKTPFFLPPSSGASLDGTPIGRRVDINKHLMRALTASPDPNLAKPSAASLSTCGTKPSVINHRETRNIDIDLVSSSPEQPVSSNSTVVKRSQVEIERAKEAAMNRRLCKLSGVPSTTSTSTNLHNGQNMEDSLAKALEREQLDAVKDKRYRELAQSSFGAYGHKIEDRRGGMARFGSGKGGVKGEIRPEDASTDSTTGIAMTQPELPWSPDERCSQEQVQILNMVSQRRNLFFTGSAGVGKSFLLQEITRLLESRHSPYQVTATTGIAALQISGSTIHSWAGIGLGKEQIDVLVKKIMGNKEKKANWKNTQVLIVDEISMMDPQLFFKLNIIGKMIREDRRPFGGLQLVLSGDFFQLPPIPEKHPTCIRCGAEGLRKIGPETSKMPRFTAVEGFPTPDILRCCEHTVNGFNKSGCGLEMRNYKFVFETEAWAECNFDIMELTKVYRQSDPAFINMLEKFRRGVCDQQCVDLLATCGTALQKQGHIKATNLHPLRSSVDRENERAFNSLEGKIIKYVAKDVSKGERGAQLKRERLKDVSAGPAIELKTGAQVLLLANLSSSSGLVNGSRGVIVDWKSADEDFAEQKNLKVGSGRGGQGFGSEEWRENMETEFIKEQNDEVLPIVFFASGITSVIRPYSWVIDIDKDGNSVSRTQVPLALAWALTIHKSQGQSLDAVGVRLTNTFEKGQAYVALSRCRTPEGMIVDGFKPGLIMAHATVVAFYDLIASKSLSYSNAAYIDPIKYTSSSHPVLEHLRVILQRLPNLKQAPKDETSDIGGNSGLWSMQNETKDSFTPNKAHDGEPKPKQFQANSHSVIRGNVKAGAEWEMTGNRDHSSAFEQMLMVSSESGKATEDFSWRMLLEQASVAFARESETSPSTFVAYASRLMGLETPKQKSPARYGSGKVPLTTINSLLETDSIGELFSDSEVESFRRGKATENL